jgi:hypothetical protein
MYHEMRSELPNRSVALAAILGPQLTGDLQFSLTIKMGPAAGNIIGKGLRYAITTELYLTFVVEFLFFAFNLIHHDIKYNNNFIHLPGIRH